LNKVLWGLGGVGPSSPLEKGLREYDRIEGQAYANAGGAEKEQGRAQQDGSDDPCRYLTCPPGDYLGFGAAEKEKQNARLCALHKLLRIKGRIQNMEREQNDTHLHRGYATFESPLWPKPPRCPEERQVGKGGSSAAKARGERNVKARFRKDASPSYEERLVFEDSNFEFHKNHKVGSVSFPGYLGCEYGRTSKEPWNSMVPHDRKVVVPVREPVRRFVSAMGEVLQRLINNQCPGGPCTESKNNSWKSEQALEKLSQFTTWYHHINRTRNGEGWEHSIPSNLRDIVGAFVHDVSCNYNFNAASHFTTQSVFATQGPPKPVDLVLKLEDLEMGLKELKHLAGKDENRTSECSMMGKNKAEDKPKGVPESKDILRVLEENDELMRELCYVYAQDFICFNYELPDACKGLF